MGHATQNTIHGNIHDILTRKDRDASRPSTHFLNAPHIRVVFAISGSIASFIPSAGLPKTPKILIMTEICQIANSVAQFLADNLAGERCNEGGVYRVRLSEAGPPRKRAGWGVAGMTARSGTAWDQGLLDAGDASPCQVPVLGWAGRDAAADGRRGGAGRLPGPVGRHGEPGDAGEIVAGGGPHGPTHVGDVGGREMTTREVV